MSSVVQNLLDNVIGDGARPSKFECYIHFVYPPLFAAKDDIYAHVKTSQFPGKSHEVIDIKFKGRSIPVKGQTKYDNTWSCTFYLSQDHKLKKAFEDWIESIDQTHNIKRLTNDVQSAQAANSALGYVTNMQIAQMDFHGYQQTAVYTLYNVFPKSVSAVDVDYSATGQIMEFTVEFSYSHFDSLVEKSKEGSFVDEIKGEAQKTVDNAIGTFKNELASVFK